MDRGSPRFLAPPRWIREAVDNSTANCRMPARRLAGWGSLAWILDKFAEWSDTEDIRWKSEVFVKYLREGLAEELAADR